LTFDLSFKKVKKEVTEGTQVPTKREFLRFIMSVFDPLGLTCPLTIGSRIIMQKIWKAGTQWDEALNNECFEDWLKWLKSLNELKSLKIPRWYRINHQKVSLHVFGDASEQAYSAVAYFVNADGNVALIAGKARVTPLKIISILRLELQAALLVCRLAEKITKEHEIDVIKTILWTDSMTVLQWIRSNPKDYKPFVAH
jgi:hypothetical protein